MLGQLLKNFTPIANGGAAEKLEFSELRYRRLFETAQDGILILDASSGKITDANPFLLNLLGYSNSELLGKQLWEIGVFKDIVESKKAFLELQTKGSIRYQDLPLQTKDGRSIAVEFVSNVFTVNAQQIIQCNIHDITDRKKAEQAMLNVMEDLKQSKDVIEVEKAKAEAILASIGEGLIAVDNNQKVMIINKSAKEILGWNMKEVVGMEIAKKLLLQDARGQIIPPLRQPTYIALSTGKMVNLNCFYIREDKSRFPVAFIVTPIKQGSKIIGALNIFRDITHETEIDRAKSEFVSLASHQLRTPLGISKWYLEALKTEGYLDNLSTTAKDYLSEVYKSNERLINLVRDLLSVSRIEQGLVKNIPKIVDVVKVLSEIVDQMQVVAREKKLTLSLSDVESQIPPINIDVLRFHEVIENLIGNALEYTNASGSVKVDVKKVEDTLLISVTDTGIGMSKADQAQLYTKFYRSEAAVSHHPGGSGLGLYLVKSYVEGWGGKILVESEVGKGSVFTVSLPIFVKK